VSPVVQMLATLIERGRAGGEFRDGIDATQLYVSIAGLGYFYLSNRYTLSAVLGRELSAPEMLEAHWRASEQMVLRFVAA
jgi:hypothetical protein